MTCIAAELNNRIDRVVVTLDLVRYGDKATRPSFLEKTADSSLCIGTLEILMAF